MSRAIKEITEALNQPQILATKVSFLRDPEEQDVLRRRFYSIHNFPEILGIIDCTHVAIVSPRNNDPLYPEHVYVNRKNYYSLNVQLVTQPVPGYLHPYQIQETMGRSFLMKYCPL
ncbi:unnamed protein product [Acanthoscelides obtectus]|uniref:Nuclease HARBI1 n=1 Tax=Acanthoscelides obtectus TaxID=200917 RepID=A0A9P0PB68_ACAOB|nr:unnamed protein product [Acanthoscelides obtectus]CAK1667636.1 Putative nuclease HARBI1 [Acanthoscelides obtectus]